MKGIDRCLFWVFILGSLVVGAFVFDKSFNSYSDMITFLSIMIGFGIASLAILFNSPLRKTLFDRKIKPYKTELHRLKDYYRYALYFEVFSVLMIFFIPDRNSTCYIFCLSINIGKHLIVAPIIIGSIFCFYKICNDLFRIFTHPTND